MTAQQCRMARAALNFGVRDLAKIADVSPNTIARLERGEKLHTRTLDFIQGAFEAQGIIFIRPGLVSALGADGIRLGNDAAKSPYGKLFEALWNVPDLRFEPAAAYDALLKILAQYLDIIEGEGRQPDVWERLDLKGALYGLDRSNVWTAASFIQRGITPPDNQSPDYPIPQAEAASVAALDLRYFRRRVARLMARGYQPARA